MVDVGFQKGDAEVGHNLVFHVNDTAGTASESIHSYMTCTSRFIDW